MKKCRYSTAMLLAKGLIGSVVSKYLSLSKKKCSSYKPDEPVGIDYAGVFSNQYSEEGRRELLKKYSAEIFQFNIQGFKKVKKRLSPFDTTCIFSATLFR